MGEECISTMDAEALCSKYKPFICKICNRYLKHLSRIGYVDYDDILQAGSMGLLQAQKTFDVAEGASFLSWAYRYINRNICQTLGIIWRGKGLYQMPPLEAHLDEPLSPDDPDGGTLADKIADTITIDVEAEAVGSDTERIVSEAINRLKEPERGLMKANIIECRSLKSVADDMGLPYWKAQDHKQKALYWIRRMDTIRALLDDSSCYRSKSVSAFQRTGSSAVEDVAFRRIELSNTTAISE